ncbi:MAG: Gfo/Idh/MocA family oxidoreductase [Gaiellaceae bacterium]|jgi:predicted dehydrogenase
MTESKSVASPAAVQNSTLDYKPVVWGILSTAKINSSILGGARASSRVNIAAVASREASRARTYAQEHEIERSYGSYDELLGDSDIEAIYISVPHALHVEWTVRALEAGKHVLCEKAFTTTPPEAERAFDVAERNELVLMEGLMWRHSPQTKRMKELVEDGSIGKLQVVRTALNFDVLGFTGPSAIQFNAELGGGSLGDMACYCVSAMRLLAGEPERVYVEQVTGETGVDVQLSGTLRFKDDVVGQLDTSLVTPYRMEVEVIGSKGSLFIGDPWFCHEAGIQLRRPDGTERIEVEAPDVYRLELENMSDAIRGVAEPLLGRTDALGQARALEALRRSAATGQPVTLGA